MNFRAFEGKNVVVETKDKKNFRGNVGDYMFPEDNNPPKESIILDAPGQENPIEIFVDDIKTIYSID